LPLQFDWLVIKPGEIEMDNAELVNLLELQADEIAEAGHAGWGNTMKLAAEIIAQLDSDLAGMTAAADSLQQDVYDLTS
jgi:hypothetical protein